MPVVLAASRHAPPGHLLEQHHGLQFARRLEAISQPAEMQEDFAEGVGLVGNRLGEPLERDLAPAALTGEFAHSNDQIGELQRWHLGQLVELGDALGGQIPVVSHASGHGPQVRHPHSQGISQHQCPLHLRFGQHLLHEPFPALGELHVGADLVEHLQPGR